MKVCTDCGHENSDDAQFCESCRGYLWAERDAAEEKQAVLAGQAAVDSTVDEQPAAVPPEREFDPPPPERPDFPEPHPDELICDQCGIGNRAEANFCRRCGSTLVGADVATRAPWWRRLRAQRPRTYSAGERRRRRQPVASTATQKARRGMFQMSRALGIIALLGIVSIGAWRGDLAGRVGDAYGSAKGDLIPALHLRHPDGRRCELAPTRARSRGGIRQEPLDVLGRECPGRRTAPEADGPIPPRRASGPSRLHARRPDETPELRHATGAA